MLLDVARDLSGIESAPEWIYRSDVERAHIDNGHDGENPWSVDQPQAFTITAVRSRFPALVGPTA